MRCAGGDSEAKATSAGSVKTTLDAPRHWYPCVLSPINASLLYTVALVYMYASAAVWITALAYVKAFGIVLVYGHQPTQRPIRKP